VFHVGGGKDLSGGARGDLVTQSTGGAECRLDLDAVRFFERSGHLDQCGPQAAGRMEPHRLGGCRRRHGREGKSNQQFARHRRSFGAASD
jgi:hypothetical protein